MRLNRGGEIVIVADTLRRPPVAYARTLEEREAAMETEEIAARFPPSPQHYDESMTLTQTGRENGARSSAAPVVALRAEAWSHSNMSSSALEPMRMRVFRLGEEPAIDCYILGLSTTQRIELAWEVTRQAWQMMGGDPDAPFRRDVGRLVRGTS